jgi:hypothetical protein
MRCSKIRFIPNEQEKYVAPHCLDIGVESHTDTPTQFMLPTNTVKCKNTERWHQQIILKLNLLGIRSSFLFFSWVAFNFSVSSTDSKPRPLFGLTYVMFSFSACK